MEIRESSMWCIQNISECNPPPFSTSDFDKAIPMARIEIPLTPWMLLGVMGFNPWSHLMGKMWPISSSIKTDGIVFHKCHVQSPPDDRGTLFTIFRCLVQCMLSQVTDTFSLEWHVVWVIHRPWLLTWNHYLLCHICLCPFSFLLFSPACLVPCFTQCGALHGFCHLLPSTQEHCWSFIYVGAKLWLSFHVHFCFAYMAFSSFFVPSQCLYNPLIMSLDVTLICVFVMNLSRSLCSQLYWPSLSELSNQNDQPFSLDENPLWRWIWESLWFQDRGTGWVLGMMWLHYGRCEVSIWKLALGMLFFLSSFHAIVAPWWTLAHIEVKLLPWFPKHWQFGHVLPAILSLGVLFFVQWVIHQCNPHPLCALSAMLISQNHQSQSPSLSFPMVAENFTVNSSSWGFCVFVCFCWWVWVLEAYLCGAHNLLMNWTRGV